MTFFESSRLSRDDVSLMWNAMSPIFEQVELLSVRDKRALVHNFLPKWPLYSFAATYSDDLDYNVENVSEEERIQNVVSLYSLAIPDYASRASDEELKSVFVPIVDQYTNSFATPLIEKDLDTFEFMALTMLMLFDGAYSNLSPKCSELCNQIRKLILRELKGYNLDRNSEEMRFIETLDVLLMVEKAVESFQRELMMCELYNVQIHEDFRALLRENNC